MTITPRTWAIALAASLGINLVLAGVIVCRTGQHGRHRPMGDRQGEHGQSEHGGHGPRGHTGPGQHARFGVGQRDHGGEHQQGHGRGDAPERRQRHFGFHGGAEGQPGARDGHARRGALGDGSGFVVHELIGVMGGFEDPRVAKQWAPVAEAIETNRSELAKTRETLGSALSKEPFDAQAAQAAFDRLRDLGAKLQADNQKIALGLASQLTPEERAHLDRPGVATKGPEARKPDHSSAPKAPAAKTEQAKPF